MASERAGEAKDETTPRPWHERTVTLIHNDGNAEEVVELGDVITDETVAYATTPEHAVTILRAVNAHDKLVRACTMALEEACRENRDQELIDLLDEALVAARGEG